MTPDPANGRTLVSWSEGLGRYGVEPAQSNPVFYALRQRAALFGYNAVNPQLLAPQTICELIAAGEITNTQPYAWQFGADEITGNTLASESLVDLDAVYSKLTPNGWLVLIAPDGSNSRSPAGQVSLFKANTVTTIARSAYGVSAKISRVSVDTQTNLSFYYGLTRYTSVLTQSEALSVAEQPLDHPLYGSLIDLAMVRIDLAGVTAVAISGNRQKIMVKPQAKPLSFVPDDENADPVALAAGDLFALISPPDFLEPGWNHPALAPCAWAVHARRRGLQQPHGNHRFGRAQRLRAGPLRRQ